MDGRGIEGEGRGDWRGTGNFLVSQKSSYCQVMIFILKMVVAVRRIREQTITKFHLN